MRKLTLSAYTELIRKWLTRPAEAPYLTVEQIRQAVSGAAHFRVGRRLTREERNER
jgi:hypothetical protein